jgi:pimeloyl-ACP methyl ester carboxylesterase
MYSTIHGRRIWYTDTGKGFPVVLIHGYLESSGIWDSFTGRLSAEFRIIVIDLPGHGRSEVYSETHSMEMMADIIRELLDKLDLSKVVLAGHSLGGYVALAFLDMYPHYLSGYCLFHSHPFADTPEATEKRKREISLVMAGKKDLMYPDNIEKMYASRNLEKMKDAVLRSRKIASTIPGNGIIALLNGMMKRPSRAAIMEEGRVPGLWILGTMDNYIPFGAIQEKVRLPHNMKIVTLKNSGHMGFVEEEDLSAAALSEFIKESTNNQPD